MINKYVVAGARAMGSSSSRDSSLSSSATSQRNKSAKPFSDATVQHLIGEQKLAPRQMMMEADAVVQGVAIVDEPEGNLECPICFNNYHALNNVVCCKQRICTNCYVELRNAQPVAKNCHCPFCHQLGFVTTYTAPSQFDYSNDVSFEKSGKKEAPSSSQRRGSGNSFPNPSAMAEKAAEKINNAFESIRSSVNANTSGSKASSQKSIGAHHFQQQDSWDSPMRSLHPEQQGSNGKYAASSSSSSSTTTPVAATPNDKGGRSKSEDDPSTPITPVSVPLASKADRASLEAQIRSQHLDFDAEREHRRQSSSGGNRQRAESEHITGRSQRFVLSSSAGGGQPSPRRRTGGSTGSAPRNEIDELGRLLAGIGARSPGGRPVAASYEDISRMEELMLQAALRESAEMAEQGASAAASTSDSNINNSPSSGSHDTDGPPPPPPFPPAAAAAASTAAAAGGSGRVSS